MSTYSILRVKLDRVKIFTSIELCRKGSPRAEPSKFSGFSIFMEESFLTKKYLLGASSFHFYSPYIIECVLSLP